MVLAGGCGGAGGPCLRDLVHLEVRVELGVLVGLGGRDPHPPLLGRGQNAHVGYVVFSNLNSCGRSLRLLRCYVVLMGQFCDFFVPFVPQWPWLESVAEQMVFIFVLLYMLKFVVYSVF